MFLGKGVGSDCTSSSSFHTFYFYCIQSIVQIGILLIKILIRHGYCLLNFNKTISKPYSYDIYQISWKELWSAVCVPYERSISILTYFSFWFSEAIYLF